MGLWLRCLASCPELLGGSGHASGIFRVPSQHLAQCPIHSSAFAKSPSDGMNKTAVIPLSASQAHVPTPSLGLPQPSHLPVKFVLPRFESTKERMKVLCTLPVSKQRYNKPLLFDVYGPLIFNLLKCSFFCMNKVYNCLEERIAGRKKISNFS